MSVAEDNVRETLDQTEELGTPCPLRKECPTYHRFIAVLGETRSCQKKENVKSASSSGRATAEEGNSKSLSQGAYAKTFPELVDKVLSGKFLPSILVLAVAPAVLLYDYYLGRIFDGRSFLWSLEMSGAVVGVYFVLVGVQIILELVVNHIRKILGLKTDE